MPSQLHEALVLLFRNRATLAVELLQGVFRLAVPHFDDARVEASDLADVPPAAYLADLVIVLRDAGGPVFGIVVEVQLSPDERKRFTWPVYAANLRARLECPTCVLVVCAEDSVARWANQPVEVGGGNHFAPIVLGPSSVPVITQIEVARADPELAVLAALAHARGDGASACAVADVALAASSELDDARATFYFDLVANVLSAATRKALLEMNPGKYEYQSEFAKRYFGQGRAEGQVEGRIEGRASGRIELLLRQLTRRFGNLPPAVHGHLEQASLAELDTYAERILDAATLEDVFGPVGNT